MQLRSTALATTTAAMNTFAAAVTTTSSSSFLSSLSSNASVVGPVSLLCSVLFTTYSTTSFLRYSSPKDDFEARRQMAESPSSFVPSPRIIQLSRPTRLTLYRFGGSFLLGIFVAHPTGRPHDRLLQTIRAMKHFTSPATFLFFANYCNSIALNRLGISLTYTSKCGIPLITVLLTWWIDGRHALPSIYALLTLIPIAMGIALASWNSQTLDTFGFIAAMVSTISQSALNVTLKKTLLYTNATGLEAQRVMAAIAFLLTISLIYIGNPFMEQILHHRYGKDDDTKKKTTNARQHNQTRSYPSPPIHLSIAAVCAYHFEYVSSFLFMKLVDPITFGTCDGLRRVAVILAGHFHVSRDTILETKPCGNRYGNDGCGTLSQMIPFLCFQK